MERRQISPLPIIGTEQFGLTEEDVARALQEAKERVQELRASLSSPNEDLRSFSQRCLPRAEEKERALSVSPQEVLARANTFYRRTFELANQGVDEKRLALQVGDEFPDLMNYYGLLSNRSWGNHLIRSVRAAADSRKPKEWIILL